MPEAVARGELECDLVYVDGGHYLEVALGDLRSFARLAPGGLVLVDDCSTRPVALRPWYRQLQTLRNFELFSFIRLYTFQVRGIIKMSQGHYDWTCHVSVLGNVLEICFFISSSLHILVLERREAIRSFRCFGAAAAP